ACSSPCPRLTARWFTTPSTRSTVSRRPRKVKSLGAGSSYFPLSTPRATTPDGDLADDAAGVPPEPAFTATGIAGVASVAGPGSVGVSAGAHPLAYPA